MKPLIFLALLFAGPAFAQTCEEQYKALQTEFAQRYQPSIYKVVANRVRAALMPEETREFLDLSKQFQAIPHDTPEHQNKHFAMQARARELVRAAAARAGYRIMNSAEGSPYDALIGGKTSEDGNLEYRVEIRSLLIMKDPLPHVTLWLERFDKNHNPWNVVTVGIMKDPADDYVSWQPNGGQRVSMDVSAFLKSQLPAVCN